MAVPRPISNPAKPSQVFHLHWVQLVKTNVVRKSRACLDGSRRAAPWLRMMVQTYSSFVELPCLRTFLAICSTQGYYICFGDVENAYQQSPPPSVNCYLEINDTVYDWHLHCVGIKLNKMKDVIHLFRALQGHPEAVFSHPLCQESTRRAFQGSQASLPIPPCYQIIPGQNRFPIFLMFRSTGLRKTHLFLHSPSLSVTVSLDSSMPLMLQTSRHGDLLPDICSFCTVLLLHERVVSNLLSPPARLNRVLCWNNLCQGCQVPTLCSPGTRCFVRRSDPVVH